MMLDGYQTDVYMQQITQTGESKSETINAPKMTGWICPVCGRGLSPYTPVCPCKEIDKGWELMCRERRQDDNNK